MEPRWKVEIRELLESEDVHPDVIRKVCDIVEAEASQRAEEARDVATSAMSGWIKGATDLAREFVNHRGPRPW